MIDIKNNVESKGDSFSISERLKEIKFLASPLATVTKSPLLPNPASSNALTCTFSLSISAAANVYSPGVPSAIKRDNIYNTFALSL